MPNEKVETEILALYDDLLNLTIIVHFYVIQFLVCLLKYIDGEPDTHNYGFLG